MLHQMSPLIHLTCRAVVMTYTDDDDNISNDSDGSDDMDEDVNTDEDGGSKEVDMNEDNINNN